MNKEDLLPTDGKNYVLVENAVRHIKNIPGMTCEIGVRRGGSSRIIIDTLIDNNDLYRHHICIDPYGNIAYKDTDGDRWSKYDYTNQMRNDCMANLYAYVHSKPVHVHFFVLEDTEFFYRYNDGIPVYDEFKQILNQYAFVNIDGPHDTQSVLNEFLFFSTRCSTGAIIVFDDIDYYSHDKTVEPVIFSNSFRLFERNGRKASYIKI